MCLGSRNQTVGWADDRSPTNSLESRNGGTRSSTHPTLCLKSGSYSEHVPIVWSGRFLSGFASLRSTSLLSSEERTTNNFVNHRPKSIVIAFKVLKNRPHRVSV